MAKKQNFVVGSTNPVTTTDMTDNQLNLAWDRLDVLNAEELNGVLYAISQQSKMNSDEIAAALTAYGITVDPTKNDQMASLMRAINDKISEAATSGKNIGSYWFAKTKTGTTVPAPTEAGQNYIDFTTMQTYESTNGTTWTSTGTLTYDTSVDCFVLITSKFWDITEQSGQQGGEAQWSSTTQSWAYWPKIVDFYNANLTGTPTTTPLTASSPNNQVANKEYVDDIAAGKIDSNTAVLLTGDQTIAGTKTFSSVPVVTAAPTATASTTATQVATTGWVNNSTSATNVVHRDSNETITGNKVFADSNSNYTITLRNTSDDKTTTPTANMDSVISFQDANSKNLGRLMLRHNTNGTVQFSIIPECSLSSADFQRWFSFVNTGTSGYLMMPEVGGATNSQAVQQAATQGWVNAPSLSTNVVHRSDYEEITGIKTFTQRSQYRLPVTKGTAPSSNQWRGIVFTDQRQTSSTWTAANNIACLQFYYMTDKSTRADLMAYQGVNATDTTNQRISIGYNSSNVVYTYAPASAVVNSIVTTTGISKNSNGYVKLGNGIIIQWLNSNSPATITLPTAFTSTNYKCAYMQSVNNNHTYNTNIVTKTTTTLQINNGYVGDILLIGY